MTETPAPPVQMPSHADVAAEIARLSLGVDASELHGLLAGHACGGGQPGRTRWLAAVLADPAAPVPPGEGPLDGLFLATQAQLADPNFGFELLLPAGGRPLAERADALLAWCRGFLGGFGLVPAGARALSEESEEALSDLGKIAGSRPAYDDPDADEEALGEIEEFVRVAALLLHGDCVLGPAHRARLH